MKAERLQAAKARQCGEGGERGGKGWWVLTRADSQVQAESCLFSRTFNAKDHYCKGMTVTDTIVVLGCGLGSCNEWTLKSHFHANDFSRPGNTVSSFKD